MADITMPEVKLPDIKLPDGLRDMTKDDLIQARDEFVKVAKDAAKRRKDAEEDLEFPDVDLSKVELPDEIADRLPGRSRPNPFIPLLALTVVGLVVVAAWWLITSSLTGPRVRRAIDDARNRMSGEPKDLVRYDNDRDLGSLVHQDNGFETGTDPYMAPSPFTDEGVAVGPGTMADEEVRAPSRIASRFPRARSLGLGEIAPRIWRRVRQPASGRRAARRLRVRPLNRRARPARPVRARAM